VSRIAKVDDKSSLNISLSYLLQIIGVIAVAVWGYAYTTEKIDFNEREIQNLRANQNKYIFPDIRTLEEQVIQLEKDVIILKTELEAYKKQNANNK
jgi:outer membrane murein-binding lipoprotein Lpp